MQIRVIPVGEEHREAAHELAAALEGYRVEVDDSDETVGKRIRNAEVEKIPFVVVYGDKEVRRVARDPGARRRAEHPLAWPISGQKLATLEPWQAGAEPSLTS